MRRLSARALGRATLARQYLLSRTEMSAVDMIEHLCGLQAQAPLPPYIGLFSRITRFDAMELSDAIASRAVVRIVTMRGTVHALTASDAVYFRAAVQPVMDRDVRTNQQHAAGLRGIDYAAVACAATAVLAERPLSAQVLGSALAEQFPDRSAGALAHAARDLLPLVQAPPRGLWGRSGVPKLAHLDQWVGAQSVPSPPLDLLVMRYLAAFGPASVRDVQAWCGLTGLGEVVDVLRPNLMTFLDESGTELFDLPDAPRPEDDVTAPVRILAPFDNILLSHANRTRIISDDNRARLNSPNGVFPPTILVDGRMVGVGRVTSSSSTARFDAQLFQRVSARRREAVEAEARRLLRFLHPGCGTREVTIAQD